MYIARDVAEICRNFAFNKRAVNLMSLWINFFNNPNMSRYGNLIADRRWCNKRTQFLRFAADTVLLIVLEYGIEFKIIDYTFAFKTYYDPAPLGHLDMILLDQMMKEHSEIIL